MLKTFKHYYLKRSKPFQYASAGLTILLVAALGTLILNISRAASPNVAVSATSGTLANGTNVNQSCSGASGSSCVVFGQPPPMDGNVALSLMSAGTPFAPTSFWNTILPNNTPVNPNNAAYLNVIAYNLCGDQTAVPETPPTPCPTSTHYGFLNSSAYSAPLYVVPANQPYVPVTDYCGNNATFVNALAGGVPVPTDAHGATGSDSEVEIYQPSTDKYWDFWRFSNVNGNWQACWGGVINNVSTSNGVFPNNLGATATSLPLIGADPRIEELQAGQINHVIGLTIGDAFTADLAKNVIPANAPGATVGFSSPATRTDGGSTDPLAIPEGLRFRLPASFDLAGYASTHPLTPVAMAIAVAAQKYGFVVNDSCPQSCIGMRVGDPTAYTTAGLPDPYSNGPGVGGVGNTGLFAGVNPGQIMKNFPWDQLEALPFNY
ncbi:MAG TPA: hypothetical protein VFC50_02080 [Candidatus Dormibacteraeota bacterium]|nr:hypothetical protein [Candidatus Dormibacteraeota bacterium]